MFYPKNEGRFPLGKTVITRNAKSLLTDFDAIEFLKRHQRGDRGDLDEDDKRSNETALIEGGRLLSVYYTGNGVKFWIITEADRSVTTILLPEDY
jgi:hypothetical protein